MTRKELNFMLKSLPASEQPVLASRNSAQGGSIKAIATKASGNVGCEAFGTDIVDSLKF